MPCAGLPLVLYKVGTVKRWLKKVLLKPPQLLAAGSLCLRSAEAQCGGYFTEKAETFEKGEK